MNEYLLRHATKEQLSHWGKMSQKVQEINRLMQEPLIYRPDNEFKGYIFAGSFQLEQPVIYELQLYRTDRHDSFRAILNGEKQAGRGGWHHYAQQMAEYMPCRILTGEK